MRGVWADWVCYLAGKLNTDPRRAPSSWSIPLVWALGPVGCYEEIDQAGRSCGEGHWSPSLGGGEPAYRASSRLLDPHSCASTTDFKAAQSAVAHQSFEAAWAAAVAAREARSFNATAGWAALVARAGVGPLRVSAVSGGRCDALRESMMAVTIEDICVRSVRTQ